MAGPFRYAAFISYSSKDSAFAQRLHRALERYPIPTALGSFDLAGKRNRVYPVFRDRDELPAGFLGPELESALAASGALIVVCSPHAAASAWVDKEIRYFESVHGQARIFAIVADGEPNASTEGDLAAECFPPSLRADRADAPPLDLVAADARKGKDGFRNAWLKVVAGVLNVRLGSLVDRDRAARRRRSLAIGALAVALSAASLTAAAASEAARARAYFLSRARVLTQAGSPEEAARLAVAALPSASDVVALLPSQDAEQALRGSGVALRRIAVLGAVGQSIGVSFTPDPARLLVYADAQTSLRDAFTGARMRTFTVDALGVGSIASPDGSRLLVQDSATELSALWDIRAARLVASLAPAGNLVSAIFSPDGHRLLTVGLGDAGVLWDPADGRQVARPGAVADAKAGSFSPDGSRLVTASRESRGGLWNAAAGTLISDLGPLPWNHSAPFSNTGRFFVTQQASDAATLWDSATGRKLLALGGAGAVRSAVFSPDDRRLVTEADDGIATLWDTTALRQVGVLGDHPLVAEYFAAGGERVVTRAEKGPGELWDANSAAKIATLGTGAEAVEVAPGGARIITLSDDHRLRLWDAARGRLVAALAPVESRSDALLEDLLFSPDGRLLAAPSDSGDVSVWALGSGARSATLRGAGKAIQFSGDGAVVIALSKDGAGGVWDARSGKEIAPLGAAGALKSVAFSDDGRRVATVANDGYSALWDAADPAIASSHGAALRGRVCTVNPVAIGRFSSSDRAGDRALGELLRGRPWDPCDWRGLLSVEGWAQAIRYWAVRAGARWDYACGERKAFGHAGSVCA